MLKTLDVKYYTSENTNLSIDTFLWYINIEGQDTWMSIKKRSNILFRKVSKQYKISIGK
jgi:hypothetical protein